MVFYSTDAGAECFFNSASPTTIQDIMVFPCISSFEIEDKELHDTALTREESEEANEHREAQLPEHTPDSLSV